MKPMPAWATWKVLGVLKQGHKTQEASIKPKVDNQFDHQLLSLPCHSHNSVMLVAHSLPAIVCNLGSARVINECQPYCALLIVSIVGNLGAKLCAMQHLS